MIKNIKTIAIILMASLLLAGCLGTKYIQQNKFMLQVNIPKKPATSYNGIVLQIEEPTIATQFANTSFVYRTSNTQYQTDYYNIFFIPASEQIKQLLSGYLGRSRSISRVVDVPSVIKAKYLLSTKILELYADYRDRNHPTGVITIEFSLFKESSGKYYELMHTTLSQATSLQQKDSESLVSAWNTDLQKIFKQLSSQLMLVMKN